MIVITLLIFMTGQTVLTNFTAATKTVTKQNKDGSWSFIIPRFFEGGTVIGGTKEPGDWRAEPESSTRERLLKGGETIAGHAATEWTGNESIHAIADIVGRRPTREGGMRVEVEHLTIELNGGSRQVPLVHAYGAGGRGYEISWGVAEEVAQMVKAILSSHHSTNLRARL